jgi:hypothetical protein
VTKFDQTFGVISAGNSHVQSFPDVPACQAMSTWVLKNMAKCVLEYTDCGPPAFEAVRVAAMNDWEAPLKVLWELFFKILQHFCQNSSQSL